MRVWHQVIWTNTTTVIQENYLENVVCKASAICPPQRVQDSGLCMLSYVAASHMWLHLICGCISYVAASHMWLHLICGCIGLLEANQSASLSFQTDFVGKLHINSLWPSDACNMTIHNCLKFGSEKGFLTDGMKPSPELMLAYQVFCGFHWEQFHKKWLCN